MTADPDVPFRILAVLKEKSRGLNILEIAAKTGLNRMSSAKYLGVLTALEHVGAGMAGKSKIYYLSRRIPPGIIFCNPIF
jgi:hypothetical protein